MAFVREVKRRLKAAVAPLLFLSLVGYFGWNVTQGERGLRASTQRLETLHEVEAAQAGALAERDMWERRVAGLRASHLDPDTLDERARDMLNMADPNDIVVPYGPKDRLF